ncbi:hypothetical protein B0T26DRAFT_768305 [Lasiosphaeria miniovina]|uniref:Uncharacterized protein n=1 Tax=Lasiosphaeria miniovina TaxID=1954250 RepID=A0AA40B6K2_9PEZI|nr:uncharacterized protein B0T26DRAFT_768305 [Lasiosphaeria miniovina]KAK0728622.1 hypothetical protein B0T26DRAFT_768305 [Lasiosphaeria miniovina]
MSLTAVTHTKKKSILSSFALRRSGSEMSFPTQAGRSGKGEEARVISFQKATQIQVPERSSPPIPRKSSRRNRRGDIQQRRMSSQRENASLAKVLPKSRTVALNPLPMNPLRMNPVRLSSSTSMPLTRISEQADRQSNDQPDGPSSGPDGGQTHIHLPQDAKIMPDEKHISQKPDEKHIAHKLDMMLAQTMALKPVPLPQPARIPSSSTSSKMTRLVKQNLFKKMSNALADRLHSKSHAKEPRTRTQDNHKQVDVFIEPRPQVPIPEKLSSVPTVRIGLKESANFSKDQDENTVGEHVPRTNLPENRESLLQPKLSEDPFSEAPTVKRPVTEFENRLRTNSLDDSITGAPLRTNPFETEKLFESKIDSMLPSPPVASSTPRSKYGRFQPLNESPTKRSRGMATRDGSSSESGASPASESKDALVQKFDSWEKKRKPGSNKRLKPHLALSYIPVIDSADRKKHPSPAKRDLELMEKELRLQYPGINFGFAKENDDTDELASSIVTSPIMSRAEAGVLRRLGVCKVSNARNGPNDGDGLDTQSNNGNKMLKRMSNQRKPSHTTRPAGMPRSHTESRFPVANFDSHMDLDELQIDAPVMSYGFTQIGSQAVF